MLTKWRHDSVGVEGGGVPDLLPQSRTIGKARLHGNQGRADVRRGDGGRVAWDLMAGEAIAFRAAKGEFTARRGIFFVGSDIAERQTSNNQRDAASGHVQGM